MNIYLCVAPVNELHLELVFLIFCDQLNSVVLSTDHFDNIPLVILIDISDVELVDYSSSSLNSETEHADVR